MKLYKAILILTLALFVVWGYFGCGPAPQQQQQGGGQQGGGQQNTTAPSISISVDPSVTNSVTNSTNIEVTIRAYDSDGVRDIFVRGHTNQSFIRIDSYGSTDFTTPVILSLIDGTNIVQAYAVDRAGNTSATSQIRVVVDTIRPTVNITSPADGQIVPENFTVSGTASDAGVSGLKAVYLSVGGTLFQRVNGTSSWSTNLRLTSSPYFVTYIDVCAEDNAGNFSSTNRIYITVDAIPPTVTITSPDNNSTITNDLPAGGVLIQGTASDNAGVAQVYVSVDGGPFQLATGTTSWSRRVRNLREATINIVAYSVDDAGNHSTTNTNRVTIDTTFLGTGEYDFWGSQIKDVYVKSGSGQLTIDIIINNTAPYDHNLFVFVDITNMTGGHQPSASASPTNDWTTGWNAFWFTNSAGINADLVIWGWLRNSSGSGGTRALGATNANKIVNGTPSSVPVSHSMTSIGNDDYKYSFTVSYTNIGSGASGGQVANVYVLYGLSGDTEGNHGMRSIFPSGVSRTSPGNWGPYISDITNKSIDYVLNP